MVTPALRRIAMGKLVLDVETPLPPEQIREALLDFSDRRPDRWPGLEPSLYEVYSVGETTADVKEGSKVPGSAIWAREAYDWSDPKTVRWTVVESNFCTPGSYVAATLNPRGDGGTRMTIEWDRTGTSFMGRLAIGVIRLTKGLPLKKAITKAFEHQQARGREAE
jgi:hypothetical protein